MRVKALVQKKGTGKAAAAAVVVAVRDIVCLHTHRHRLALARRQYTVVTRQPKCELQICCSSECGLLHLSYI